VNIHIWVELKTGNYLLERLQEMENIVLEKKLLHLVIYSNHYYC